MFFMKDAAQQALDINIGRVLEIFRTGIINRAQACENLHKFFEGASKHDTASLNASLMRILERIDTGALESKDARLQLVKAALASEKNDMRYVDILHNIAETV
ncbi:MAG: hypothetical protein WBQ60_06555 [Asticcacaulis sp.]